MAQVAQQCIIGSMTHSRTKPTLAEVSIKLHLWRGLNIHVDIYNRMLDCPRPKLNTKKLKLSEDQKKKYTLAMALLCTCFLEVCQSYG